MSCHPRVTEWTTTIQAHLPHLTKPQATVLRPVEAGDGPGPLLCADRRQCVSGHVAGPQRAHGAPARGASSATRPRPSAGPRDQSWWSRRALSRCWPGSWTSGRAPNWPWPSMPRPWAPALRSWRSAWSIGAVPSRWPGPSWRPRPTMPGAGSGCACCARCAGRSHGPGRSCVLADRGLYARWLFRRITRLGWHPFLRINTGGTFRPTGHVRRVSLAELWCPSQAPAWQGTGIAFKGRNRQLHCTLLACWEAGYKIPWLLLTDLPPEASTACWYGLRAWIEQGSRSPSARAGSGTAPT